MNTIVIRRYIAELLGTALLLAAVVGSGVMAQRLSGGNDGVALLANAIATGGALYVLILGLQPISGAHFNPVVTLIEAAFRRLPRAHVPGYLVAQFAGALAGVATLCAVQLETGKTHQIRIHLAESGHPLVGEPVYIRDYRGPVIAGTRLMLHAATLGFEHPITGERVALASEPPVDFAAVVDRLKLGG